ncbi:SidA/IucD/PvdA family monooxygenase [Actinoplanes sp. NPDC049596]|uniref:lysine N(6)-hydroxylase/L-ornithine N(5)-oxygenase family protein n=1 Tax=unclassified Actinoplanes TaxID=2626549 RepID=UPI00344A7378
MTIQEVDVIGIGYGPSNIALSIALAERYPVLRAVYLESQSGPFWQPGMLLDGSDIQNNPLRDLITPVNPRSRYSFVNYLHETGRFFQYLNLGLHYPFRKEYASYVQWAASNLKADVLYNTRASRVGRDRDRPGMANVVTGDGEVFRAKAVVVASGRTPNIPAPFPADGDARVRHFTKYLDCVRQLEGIERPRVAVVGGSQSAVELMLDLRNRYPSAQIHGVLRTFGYRQKDTSPFMDEVYFPEFIDYYYSASDDSKRELSADLRYTNYSAADRDVIERLYLSLHEDRINGTRRTQVLRSTDVIRCHSGDDSVTLDLRERHSGAERSLDVDLVVLATGFKDLGADDEGRFEFLPKVLEGFRDDVSRGSEGQARVARDYRLEMQDGNAPSIYLNGLCETSHGMGDAGSFSLLALRAEEIARSLVDRAAKPAI